MLLLLLLLQQWHYSPYRTLAPSKRQILLANIKDK
jgi:hypothetical protein